MAQYHNQISRLSREIAELQKNDAQEAKKAVRLQGKINRIQQAVSRSSNLSTIPSKLREMERAEKDLASIADKRARLARKILEKNKNLDSYRKKQLREDEMMARKAMNEIQKKLIRDRTAYRGQIDKIVQLGAQAPIILSSGREEKKGYDFFISYASEDKESIVRNLAKRLRAKGAKVWYDEFVLKVGDSLNETIDYGLASSLFGVVVLSPHFFIKKWTKRELGGLLSLEADGVSRIFPIWHEISKDDIARHSPMLLDRIGLPTYEYTVEEIAEKLLEAKKLYQKRRAGASSS